jgi:hypothetical protein
MPLSFQRLLTFLRSILHAIPPAPSAPTSSSPEASDSGARESRSAAARCGDAGVLGRARVEGWMCGWGGRTPMGCGLRRRRRRRRAREERGWRRFLAGAPRLGESGVLSLAHSGYIKLKKNTGRRSGSFAIVDLRTDGAALRGVIFFHFINVSDNQKTCRDFLLPLPSLFL